MPDHCGSYIYATTHEFKNDIARWTRLLERGVYKAVLVRRRSEVVGVYATSIADHIDRMAQMERARKEGPDFAGNLEADRPERR